MKRRDFSVTALTALSAVAASTLPHTVLAQGAAPKAGKDYVKLEMAVASEAPEG